MDLHLVGGFLGSGKTTAIAAAAKILMAKGLSVGIVTNDQGRYLVDAAFFEANAAPTVQVSGGCFCCNYDDLSARLDELIAQYTPDVIFAESVGSCADIVATVVRPLLDLRQTPSSFSVFTDGRLLQHLLEDKPLPFSENVIYIYQQQIEEAGLLIINKADLLENGEAVLRLAQARYPEKTIWLQNSLDDDNINGWIDVLAAGEAAPGVALNIDYDRYGDGEARLGWLDQELAIMPPNAGLAVYGAVHAIWEALATQNLPIGHFKVFVSGDNIQLKTSAFAEGDLEALRNLPDRGYNLLLNARVEAEPADLERIVQAAIAQTSAETGAAIIVRSTAAFKPGFPNPTHRML